MKRVGWSVLVLLLTVLTSAGVWGQETGPNVGGVLVIHSNPDLVYSAGTDYGAESPYGCSNDIDCPNPATPPDCTCGPIVASVPSPDPEGTAYVCWVYAAFPIPDTCPRVKGLTFGVTWDEPSAISVVAWDMQADLELPTTSPAWPSVGSGTALTWAATQQSIFFQVYWFALYAYYDTTFELMAHPSQGGFFGDDAVPSHLQAVVDYGRLGIGVVGHVPDGDYCLPPVPTLETSWGRIKSQYGQ
jgi:hypothetical protein